MDIRSKDSIRNIESMVITLKAEVKSMRDEHKEIKRIIRAVKNATVRDYNKQELLQDIKAENES